MNYSEHKAAVLDVRGALRKAMARLGEAGVGSHALAAELLLMKVLGCERAWLYSRPEQMLEPKRAEQYFTLVAQRIAGIPTQYLTGRQEFWGLEFEVTPVDSEETSGLAPCTALGSGPPRAEWCGAANRRRWHRLGVPCCGNRQRTT